MAEPREARWQEHPVLARLLRVTIFVVPFLTAMLVAFLLSAQLPIAESTEIRIVRWLGIVLVSTVAMMGADRLARKLLPLSALLKLTLLFPDQAPSRFRIAMRTGTTHQLRQRIEDASRPGVDETPAEAAERLLELVGLLSHHDRLTRGHSERVRAYTHLLGEEMGLTETELDKIRWAGLLHDVGKTAIDPAILNKPGRLTDDEYETIKSHPMEGYALVAPLAGWLGDSLRAVWEHHERFDGAGYPQGLSGTDIALAARIVSVADCYDVMTSARSYKQPMPAGAARAELAACSGSQFDPVVVRAFLNISLGRLRLMAGPLAWFAQLALFEPAGVVHAAPTGQAGGTGAAGTAGSSGAGAATTAAGGSAGSLGAAGASSIAASAGTSSLAGTAAAVTLSVAASTAGIVAAGPVEHTTSDQTQTAAETTVDAPVESLGEPGETIFDLAGGQFRLQADDMAADDTGVPVADAGRPPVAGSGGGVAGDGDDGDDGDGGDADDGDADAGPASVVTTTKPSDGSTTTVTSTVPGSSPSGDAVSTTVLPETTVTTATTTTTTPSGTTSAVTTLPEITTTTSTLPEITTTTSTLPEITTTTTTSPATTTTLPTGIDGLDKLYLGGDVLADVTAMASHRLSTERPPDIALPNFDTDRDAMPGALLAKGDAGIAGTDPTRVLKFSTTAVVPLEIDGDVRLEVFVAAKDLALEDVVLQAGLYHCAPIGGCVLLSSDEFRHRNANQFRKAVLFMDDVVRTIPVGDRLELRLAVLDTSDDDAWVAFGTHTYRSLLDFDDDDD